MADLGKLEYQVRMAPRYYVTRYHESADGAKGSSETKGVYDNLEVAHEVAYALCKAEHARLGLAPGDERIVYPAAYPGSLPSVLADTAS